MFVILRRTISSLVLIFISLGLFGICSPVFLYISRLQFGQIFLDMSVGAAVVCLFIILASFVFGRIYCSVLCPLGVFQDFSGALGTYLTRKKYSFHRHNKLFRYFIFIFVVTLFILGIPSLIGILDPYSIYVREAARLLDNTAGFVVSVTAPILKIFNIYASYSSDSINSMPVLFLILIFFAAFFRGRLFCNTICPVGMILGCVSQASIIRPAFKDNCTSCGKCEAVCKSECVNIPDKLIDLSRCVMCGKCVAACPVKAISFSGNYHKHNQEKRETIKSMTSIAVFTVLPFLKAKNFYINMPVRNELSPNIPAGAMSWARFLDKCISCHACIKRCPPKVLEPASVRYGIHGVIKPVLNFEKGFCQYDCVVCGQTCPFGAIMPISVYEKHRIQIGIASFSREICVITTKGKRCGACAEHCPTGALEMVSSEKNHFPILTLRQELCVGCGACEYICPVVPQKAIYVEPLAIHQTAEILEMQDNTNILEETNNDFVF
jgi:ferredoxin